MTKNEVVKNYRAMIQRTQGHAAPHLRDDQVLAIILENLQRCPACGNRVWQRSDIEKAWAAAKTSHDLTMAVGRVLTSHCDQSPSCLRKMEAEHGATVDREVARRRGGPNAW